MKKLMAIGLVLFGLSSMAQHVDLDSTDTEVAPEPSNVNIYAPNAFTPDGDFYNDSWQVYMEGIDVYDFHLIIFDRSGQMIWESYDISVAWDGTYAGNIAPDGIYPWVIQAKDENADKIHQFKGFITLMR